MRLHSLVQADWKEEFRGGFDFESIVKSDSEDTELKRFYFTLGMRFDIGSVLFRK